MAGPVVRDTHAAIFTRIPISVTRRWSNKVLSSVTKNEVSVPSPNHQHSLINMITLSVEYNDDIITSKCGFDEEDDASSTQIEVWQEVRRDWVELEKAVEQTIDAFVNRAITRVDKARPGTIDALAHTRTIYKMKPVIEETLDESADGLNELPIRNRSKLNSVPTPVINDNQTEIYQNRKVKTIVADDSVSQLSRRDLKSIAKYVARQDGQHSSSKADSALLKLGKHMRNYS